MQYIDMSSHKEKMLSAEKTQPHPPSREPSVPPPSQDDRQWTVEEGMAWERDQAFQDELRARADRLNKGLFPFGPDQSEYEYWLMI